jgi:hypothetical protein
VSECAIWAFDCRRRRQARCLQCVPLHQATFSPCFTICDGPACWTLALLRFRALSTPGRAAAPEHRSQAYAQSALGPHSSCGQGCSAQTEAVRWAAILQEICSVEFPAKISTMLRDTRCVCVCVCWCWCISFLFAACVRKHSRQGVQYRRE